MAQASPDQSSLQRRLLDDVETTTNFQPISGLELVPAVSLVEAIEIAQRGDVQLAGIDFYHNVRSALKFAKEYLRQNPSDVLALEQIAAIHLYTQNSPFFLYLNIRMRDEKREVLQPYYAFIKLLLSGLNALPPVREMVYRAVKMDLHASFPKGAEPIWYWHTHTDTHTHTYIYIYICEYIHTYIHTFINL